MTIDLTKEDAADTFDQLTQISSVAAMVTILLSLMDVLPLVAFSLFLGMGISAISVSMYAHSTIKRIHIPAEEAE